MAGENRFSRIPPESTGDRLTVTPFYELGYENRTNPITTGADITGVSSGFAGTIAYVRADTATTGSIVISPDENTRENSVEPTGGENLQIDGVTVAQVVSDANKNYPLFTSNLVLASGDNPLHTQSVDRSGSAFVRFTDGPASLDPFGKLRTSGETILGEHAFPKNNRAGFDWTAIDSAGGSIGYDSDRVSVLLTTPTTSGALAKHTSDLYHHYFPGQGQHVFMTASCGDTGKANVRRRWGYYNDENGAFFELNGTSLRVVVRSNTSGSVVDTVVEQADWNVDALDGSFTTANPSNKSLDISNINLYYIDMAWLGAGLINYGVVIEGERILVHQNFTANKQPQPWARTASLPLRIEQENTGVAGSSSEFRFTCGVVSTEIDHQISDFGINRTLQSSLDSPPMLDSGAESFMFAVRNYQNKHSVMLPVEMDVIAFDSDGNDASIRINVYRNGSTTGGVWGPMGNNSDFEVNGSATSFNLDSASRVQNWQVKGKQRFDNLSELFTYAFESIKGKADGTPVEYVITGQKIKGNGNITTHFSALAHEIIN